MSPLLSVKGLTLRRDDGEGSAIINDLNLDVDEGEVVIIKGESGSGKTSLLKCIAELTVYQAGEILLHGKYVLQSVYRLIEEGSSLIVQTGQTLWYARYSLIRLTVGVPKYRTLVQYIPQRPSLLPGTPLDFLARIRSFASRRQAGSAASSEGIALDGEEGGLDPMRIAEEWGIEKVLWGREWSTLSGGEGQRIALAIAVGVGAAEVVLLDEPTSALDAETMKKVETTLLGLLSGKTRRTSNGLTGTTGDRGLGPKAYVWITHEAAQAERCGTRQVDIARR